MASCLLVAAAAGLDTGSWEALRSCSQLRKQYKSSGLRRGAVCRETRW
jgi:hypothetical protein